MNTLGKRPSLSVKIKKTLFHGLWIALLAMLVAACNGSESESDAYGNFESDELIISPEVQGRILQFNAGEGDLLSGKIPLAIIDSTSQVLKREQLETGLTAIAARMKSIDAQIDVLKIQQDNLEREFERVSRLLDDGAATRKQFDDMQGQIRQLKAQIAAQEVQKEAVKAEKLSLQAQISQVNDLISRSRVYAPEGMTLLTRYREAGEIAVPGQALCKVADLRHLYLRAYLSGSQLAAARIGDEVTVLYDGQDSLIAVKGIITWISAEAEFTPKTIQTREERVDLVYAVKVRVENDGAIKIGMPGELKLRK